MLAPTPLPVVYKDLNAEQRRLVRRRYEKKQEGLCYHCRDLLLRAPPASIRNQSIKWSLFPPDFLKHPVHLHHDHETGLTIGAVHAYCNAVLWQYHGE